MKHPPENGASDLSGSLGKSFLLMMRDLMEKAYLNPELYDSNHCRESLLIL